MKIFREISKDARHRTKNTFINFLLAATISAGGFIIFTIFMRILPRAEDTVHHNLLTWWVNTKYGEFIGMRCIPTRENLERKPYGYGRGWLDPKAYNYTLTISDKGQWPQPDFAAKYRSLLNEVRSQRHVHRRSHIQEAGTRVTCWPENRDGWEDGGFYSRQIGAVELDWLELPRFQDTLRSQDPFTEHKFCEKFKKLLPFHYGNSSWYHEIVKLDEKHARSHLLGCEPGFIRKYEGDLVTDVQNIECYKRSPLVAWQKIEDRDVMWHLEQPMWALEDWSDGDWGTGAAKWEAAGKTRNALTMDEKAKAIELSGGSRMLDEKLKNFWGCWYGTAKMDCAGPTGYTGYEDWKMEKRGR